MKIQTSLFDLTFGAGPLLVYEPKTGGPPIALAGPEIELDGAVVSGPLASVREIAPLQTLPNGAREHRLGAAFAEGEMELFVRVAEGDPVVRFRYALRAAPGRKMTKVEGRDNLMYLGVSLQGYEDVTEVRLSEFSDLTHCYAPAEHTVSPWHFAAGDGRMGPVLVASSHEQTILLAYEHGSQYPDTYLEFALAADRFVKLRSTKGNYHTGQQLPFESIWFEVAAVAGGRRQMAEAFRRFVLEHQSTNAETRQPYVFYNTWNHQERNKHWRGKPYLSEMNLERMTKEIEVAAEMGIEVFVLDTGWFEKAGDWRVSRQRFPDELREVKKLLDSHGMKLGLWFNPTVAALSSEMYRAHEDCVTSWRGKKSEPWAIWETEKSNRLCLCSRYAAALTEELIRVARELGVVYFKWDGVDQHGCDDPGHDHGGSANTAEERGDCFAFGLPLSMAKVADDLSHACPGAIVDFDVTEASRSFGLGFLASGKYFSINNGPYFHNLNAPTPADANWNIFFNPGNARGWFARAAVDFDSWLPSVLFLTHFFPDDVQRPGLELPEWAKLPKTGEELQMLSLASLVLGPGGLWGDLCAVSDEGVARIRAVLGRYKNVRADMALSYPVRSGARGSSPEVHEKINAPTGRGAVAIFANVPGTYTYVTAAKVAPEHWKSEGAEVEGLPDSRARITATFPRAGAKLVFFGVG
jgi:alpha-galactosidase